jgi:phosphoglycerate dehydrogenase-like enzyme
MKAAPSLLILESSWRRLADRIRRIAPDLRACIMSEDGSVSVDGKVVPIENVHANLGWANLDVFASAARRGYFRALLKIADLQWVQTASAGVDDAVFTKLVQKGVMLTNSDSQGPAIADFILGAALDFYQKQDERRQLQATHTWKKLEFRELGDTSWLIVGYGHIGRETARRASAFGASVSGIRRTITATADEFAQTISSIDRLPQLLPQADVVVLSLGLNDATRNLANADFLARMRTGSLFINIGRGGLVDETALIAALEHGAPARATLDVFQTEPLPPDHPLWSHPKVRVIAHASASGSGTPRRGDELFLDNLARYMKGESMRNVVKALDLS